MTTVTIQTAGYIVSDNDAIYGCGATSDAAWTDLLRTMHHARIQIIDDREYRSTEQQEEDEIAMQGGCTMASSFRVQPASAALLAQVENQGGAIAWDQVGNVCCTRDEAEAE